ncbi:flavodoxin family protein [Tissierella sp. MSJ-40]|uniref:Flavodoxin family protein n=1 Tax=Tissierella simiarum TaxID=2841534 RepID=A0ABS6E7J9_9FIRM|nr:flavodoxin family protein [Tissierella simiarum]MBU5438203.1 flavodoxin family protein [Tissierella simiarum]
MKKVLALMGSPRKNKNTDILLDYLLQNIEDTEYEINKVYLGDMKINHCTGCNYCGSKGQCVFKDDMISIYEGFDSSDIVILAAPLYFNSINGLAKNMIDRCQKYWSIKYQLGQEYKRNVERVGLFLSVGGAEYSHNQFNGAIPIIDFFFKAINVKYKGNYFVSNTDNRPINKRLDVREELKEIGKNIWTIEDFYLHR